MLGFVVQNYFYEHYHLTLGLPTILEDHEKVSALFIYLLVSNVYLRRKSIVSLASVGHATTNHDVLHDSGGCHPILVETTESRIWYAFTQFLTIPFWISSSITLIPPKFLLNILNW